MQDAWSATTSPSATIAAGSTYSCTLRSGLAYCWGRNNNGQLGDGTTTQRNTPVAVSTSGVLAGKTLTQISTGDENTCALDGAGRAYCWGLNSSGEVGDGTTTQRNSPVAVDTSGVLAGKKLTEIVSAYRHTCAVDSTGLAYCWGDNTYGQVGDGTTTQRDSPVAVYTAGALAGKSLAHITASDAHTCALDTSGVAYCWGDNQYGEGGNNSTTQESVPVRVLSPSPPSTGITATPTPSAAAISWTAPARFGTGTLTGKPAAVPALSFPAPPAGEVGVAYSDTLSASGGTGPYTWSVSTGSLPVGITLDASTGALSGTPSAAGFSGFTVMVTDADKQTATEVTSITVAAGPVLSFPSPPAGEVGVAYSDTLAVSGGTGPFTWSVSAGTLPAGITLNASSGVLSGTPAAVGSSAFTVQVSDADGVTATEAVTLVAGAGPLVIVASAGTPSAVPGGTVTFTVTISNTSTTPFTAVTFTDALAQVLDGAVYNGDAAATAGAVSFASPNLTWTGNLAAGAAAVITLSVTVRNPAAGRGVLSAAITSATLGSTCPAGGTDPRCAVTVTISGLAIVKTASTATAVPGQKVTYTITVTNSGQTPYTGAAFTDALGGVLDDATYDADASTTAGTVTFASPTLSWSGDLAPGAAAAITYSVTVNGPDTGDHILASTLTSATAGSNCPAGSADPACGSTIPVLAPALSIVKTADTTAAVPGQVIGFTITVTNTRQTPYTGAAVTDSLAQMAGNATYDGDAAATTGTVSFTRPYLVWTGTLAPGATAVITYSVTVNNPDAGDKHVTSTVTSTAASSTCPPGTTSPNCRANIPVLTITKTASVASALGSTVGYTITVANTGQTDYTGATFSDPLTGVLGDAVYNGDATIVTGTGIVTYASSTLTWTGDLAVGATATITYSITIDNPATSDLTLTNTVTSDTSGSNCLSGSTDTRCAATVTVIPITISLSDLSSTFTLAGLPGGTAQQTAAVTMTVDTNNPTGYTVTVQPTTSTLAASGITAAIPVSDLEVRETGQSTYQALSATTPTTIHTQTSPSASTGDTVSNDYQLTIPDITSGTYTTTLNYIATATP